MNANDILAAISKLSAKHVLSAAPANYKQGFADAAIFVYPPKDIAKILQDKFFIPNDSNFDSNTFIESAAELSVQNHLKHTTSITAFEIEKQVNPPKDVDAYYELESVRVSLEVKCPREKANDPNSLVVKMAGRVPAYAQEFKKLHDGITEVHPNKVVVLGQNKDNTFKDFLTLSHDKFSPNSGVDDCNILFVACGYHFNINEWRMHLLQNEGLFTSRPFHPTAEYELVDVAILSNLKYFHTEARQYHDWTLKNVFILPIVNPHGRKGMVSISLLKGLSVFEHHLRDFNRFDMMKNANDVPDFVMDAIKVGVYVEEHLSEQERLRFFPVKLTK